MNYKHIYDLIIENRNIYAFEGYTENHHIIPRSLGGTDEPENLIKLSAREHFLCHYLLAKIFKKETFEWYKMNHAFMMMKCESLNQNRYFNSRLYEALKLNFSSVMSLLQRGKGNSQYGTMWISNIELEESKKIQKTDPIPEGWVKGRKVWNRVVKEEIKKRYKKPIQVQAHVKCYEKYKHIQSKIKEVNNILDIIEENNFKSIPELLRSGFDTNKSPESMVNMLKKYSLKRFKSLIMPKFSGKNHANYLRKF
jgi:hypothetical protein